MRDRNPQIGLEIKGIYSEGVRVDVRFGVFPGEDSVVGHLYIDPRQLKTFVQHFNPDYVLDEQYSDLPLQVHRYLSRCQ